MIALLLCALAWAGPFEDVRRPLGGGAWANWTAMRLELVISEVDPTLATDARPLEMRAIRRIDDAIERAVGAVPLRVGTSVSRGAEGASARVRRTWRVAESRYFDSGRIEVVGVVELQEVLATWNTARSEVEPGELATAVSGVVIDARGHGVVPTYAPQIVDGAGEVLFDAVVWKHLAFGTPPVVWVSDPAAPQASMAGATPWFASAEGAPAGTLVLSDHDADRWRSQVEGAAALGRGAVVIVVDARP